MADIKVDLFDGRLSVLSWDTENLDGDPHKVVLVEDVSTWKPHEALGEEVSTLFRQKGFTSFFLIGILNGLLPCGLIYLGVAGAIATGDTIKGSLFMMIFGLGTLMSYRRMSS